eukprot:3310247-Pyramimonas_sp.AAC.1
MAPREDALHCIIDKFYILHVDSVELSYNARGFDARAREQRRCAVEAFSTSGLAPRAQRERSRQASSSGETAVAGCAARARAAVVACASATPGRAAHFWERGASRSTGQSAMGPSAS